MGSFCFLLTYGDHQNMSPPQVGCVTLPAPPQTMSF